MNTSVVTISQDEDVCEAMRMMALNNITGLPVIDDNSTLLGIITEKDVLALLHNNLDNTSLDRIVGAVGEFMTRKVVCFEPEDDLRDIAECLSSRGFRRVPILDHGRLVGIISRRDVIRYLRDLLQEREVMKDNILELLY